MEALAALGAWPVEHHAAVVHRVGAGVIATHGETERPFALASVTKLLAAWAVLVAVEEGIVGLDEPLARLGSLRHLLAHASGLPFEGSQPIATPGRRRIYSNTGIERAAALVAEAAGMTFATYLSEAVLHPLGMRSTVLHGSAAHGMRSTAADLARFLAEVGEPTLIDPRTAAEARTVQFADLDGVVPGVGTFRPCPWGLGFEIKGGKSPHWMGSANTAAAFGHFGGAGTFWWMEEGLGIGMCVLTDRPFSAWAADALRLWPQLSDAVLAEHRG